MQPTKYETKTVQPVETTKSYSPNSTQNTNSRTVNTIRYDAKGNEQRSVSPIRQYGDNKGTTIASSTYQAGRQEARPISFAAESGKGITANQVDDIYTRYCLHD